MPQTTDKIDDRNIGMSARSKAIITSVEYREHNQSKGCFADNQTFADPISKLIAELHRLRLQIDLHHLIHVCPLYNSAHPFQRYEKNNNSKCRHLVMQGTALL